MVPNSAVVTETGVDYVYAVVNGVVKKVPCRPGSPTTRSPRSPAGLEEGDLVVTEGQSFLNEGEKVTMSQNER